MADNTKTPLVWLITGTSSGFGSALVASVLARGDRVIATSRSVESIKHLETPDNSDFVRARELDVTSGAAAIAATIAEAAGIWGRLDVVVNNAGAGYGGLLEEAGTDLLRKQFDVNFFGVMDVVSGTLPHMRAQKAGTIVFVGSRSAWKPEIPGYGPYGSSKAAVHALADCLAAEVAPLNIRVLLVQPGSFRTAIARQPFHTANPISEYDPLRNLALARMGTLMGSERGDPAKAMEAVVDVVRGEGSASRRKWPGCLVLGVDAEVDVRAKSKRMVDHLDEWSDVVRAVDLEAN
ncbi:hypothetical protein C8F04DRAFT_1081745 [Mycena alexandri]|uniref:NAD(P)-binding protein n=1 Tax=Mycena alexandri TaxID=1745969 RepID=A0AAD6TAA2_9AGAR|nr:hypothetical protein C8F04DRAFT_1146402 [Mycena alexandri]KAJ7040683.1 hypothetical protein C8F04DRAFT_1081745 [Mycena alexandri]